MRTSGAAALSGVNPTFSHERFHEAHDLIVRSWTEPGPFEFHGKHYHVEYVNPWPRPYQKPHPQLLMSAATPESAAFAARHKAIMGMTLISDLDVARKNI